MTQDLYIYRCRCNGGCNDCQRTGIISANRWQDLPDWKKEELDARENYEFVRDSIGCILIVLAILYVFFWVG